MANSVDPDQTAQSVLGPRCLLLYLIRQLCKAYLQQTTFSDAFFSWRFKG